MDKTENKVGYNSCLECALKHVTMARIQFDEYRQDNEANASDLLNCIGNLGCAELHLIDTHEDMASAVREIRKSIMAGIVDLIPMFDDVVIAVARAANLFYSQHEVKEDEKHVDGFLASDGSVTSKPLLTKEEASKIAKQIVENMRPKPLMADYVDVNEKKA